MVKFRTMVVDAEKATGAILAQADDPRLTPVGAFLRKSRLDELPQLLHVLSGKMSIVGPRPERPEIMEHLAETIPFFDERMRLIKPGITGLAQINLAYDGSFDPRIANGASLQKHLRGFRAHQKDKSGPNGGPNGQSNGLAGAESFGNKLIFDLAYSAILENPIECLKTDLEVILKTPLVMLRARGR